MIIREAPIDNAWYRAAGTWIVALLAINCLLWPLLDHYQYSLEPLWPIALALPLGGIILWLVGKFLSEPVRVIKFVAVLGIFGIFPLFLAAALPITALIYFSHGTWLDLLIYVLPCLILLAYWLFRELDNLEKNTRKQVY